MGFEQAVKISAIHTIFTSKSVKIDRCNRRLPGAEYIQRARTNDWGGDSDRRERPVLAIGRISRPVCQYSPTWSIKTGCRGEAI